MLVNFPDTYSLMSHDYLAYLDVQVVLGCCVGCHSGEFTWHAGICRLKTELISLANASKLTVNCTKICRQERVLCRN
jgi:hypothetical protein